MGIFSKKNKKKKDQQSSTARHMADQASSGRNINKNTYFRSSQRISSARRPQQKLANAKKLNLFSIYSITKVSSLRENTSKIVTFIIFTSIVIVLFFASTTSSNSSRVQIVEDSFRFREVSEYQDFINEYISSHPLARSKLFFPITEFNEAFLKNYPEVTSIRTNIPVADREVSVIIETPAPLVRLLGQDASSEQFVDANGTVIKALPPDIADLSGLPILTINNSSIPENSQKILTDNEVEIITLLNEEITPSNIAGLPANFTLSSIVMDAENGRMTANFNGVQYGAIFSAYTDVRNQVGSLKAMLTELYAQSSGGDTSQLPLEYIDVRVYEKVFIR